MEDTALVLIDTLKPLPIGKVILRGRLGNSLRLSIANRLKKVDYVHLVEPFRQRNERDGRWRCEFWGKIVRSSILSYRGQPDPELRNIITCTVNDLISTQNHEGCICSYPRELETKDWDIWGRKYVLIGLIRYYQEIAPSNAIKEAIIRELDYLMTQVGPEGKNIVDCGHHAGLAASSILEPVVLAYRITGEERYLSYALWIVDQGGSNINNVFLGILQGIPPRELGNGKAYEMMSCFEGLAELYRETGNPDYLNAVLKFYRAVRDQEIFITGVGGLKDKCGEFWDNGKIKQTQQNVGALGETCVTTTWIKFCGQVLRLTGDSTVVDEMERTLYNGVLGAMVPDGSWWMHRNPTPLAGASSKMRADDQIPGYGEDCCVAQGPKALAMAPWLAVMQDGDGLVVNLYESTEALVKLEDGLTVKLTIDGDFPRCHKVSITVKPSRPGMFPIRLRIPVWSGRTSISILGVHYECVPGSYLTIDRFWGQADHIEMEFDLTVRILAAPDGGDRVALMRGPIVLAQDSRLGIVDSPVFLKAGDDVVITATVPAPAFFETYQLPDGRQLCDYSSAGNEFREENRLCVWFKNAL